MTLATLGWSLGSNSLMTPSLKAAAIKPSAPGYPVISRPVTKLSVLVGRSASLSSAVTSQTLMVLASPPPTSLLAAWDQATCRPQEGLEPGDPWGRSSGRRAQPVEREGEAVSQSLHSLTHPKSVPTHSKELTWAFRNSRQLIPHWRLIPLLHVVLRQGRREFFFWGGGGLFQFKKCWGNDKFTIYVSSSGPRRKNHMKQISYFCEALLISILLYT